MTPKEEGKVVRREILRVLSREALTSEEIASRIPGASSRRVERELAKLVRVDLVCARGDRTTKSVYIYETWERALARLREKSGGRRVVLRSAKRQGERIA